LFVLYQLIKSLEQIIDLLFFISLLLLLIYTNLCLPQISI